MSQQSKSHDELEMKEPVKRRRRTAPWLLGGLVLFLLSVLVAQQLWLWTFIPPDTASDTLLLYALSSLNFVAFIVFAFIFVRNLLKLRRERRERQLGSKIKTRLVVYFIAVSLLPITAMAFFSYLFLNRSLEKWFGGLREDVVKEVRHEAFANQARNAQYTTDMLATMIDEQPALGDESFLAKQVANGHLAAIEIISQKGEVRAKSMARLPASELEEVSKALEVARISGGNDLSLTDGNDYDVISVSLRDGRSLFVVPPRYSDSNLSKSITDSEIEYRKLVGGQRKVRSLGLSTLGLLTLLLLFAATWAALHLARGIATPIKALAEASNEVARGNLEHRVETIADDELALLADSFNQMTAQLAENRRRIEVGAAELREKNLALEERRNYIETVLESLTTGVISFDENDRVTTLNAAAAQMLRLAEQPHANLTLAGIASPEDRAVLDPLLRRARRTGSATGQTELARVAGQEGLAIPVALTATALSAGAKDKGRGVVLVIEDLSELLTAQRAAAWSEVARRMAHEIKNPLTPIQLSAERIAKNFHRSSNGGGLADANGKNGDAATEKSRVASVIDECTQTITREVAGLKAMVDEFSRFARLPHARLEVADLNEVVRQAIALYEDRLEGVRMDVHLARTLPAAMLDSEQLRRVFVNLIDNALESLADSDGERRITLATAHDPARGLLLAEVTDTGHGIPGSNFTRLFQPYFSTRGRGTGLGLAIVQRIIMDHSGRIRAEANHPRGAKFIIEIPTTNV
ncbi:MAG TPA: ATP-binding protein [Pyrinomonadaceae bacterium]|jgi:PAS domain S-box-containing protein|nr:ATP-binding protein [Pyrinomonadaceae bacterium]